MLQAESGTAFANVFCQLSISKATFYLWRKKFAHLSVSEVRRLRSLEYENARRKRVVADLSRSKSTWLAEALRKKAEADTLEEHPNSRTREQATTRSH